MAAWASKTKDGSLSDLATPPRSEVWDEVAAEPDLCQRVKCQHFQKCFVFRARRIAGLEQADAGSPQLARTLAIAAGGQLHKGWFTAEFDTAQSLLLLRVSEGLRTVLPQVIRRVRAMLDLDADPKAINAVLHKSFPQGDGLRVPGAVSGYELAVRAVLGQQITVAAARTLGSRLVEALGEPIDTPVQGLDRLFPSPEALAKADPDLLGRLGIVRQRQAALQALAREACEGRLRLHPGADVPATLAALQALPGIGDWTAQYIALRALGEPDAFPAGDLGLRKAAGNGAGPLSEQALLARAEAWRPWRGYAALHLWTEGGTRR